MYIKSFSAMFSAVRLLFKSRSSFVDVGPGLGRTADRRLFVCQYT